MIIRSQNKLRITTDLDIWMEHREIGTREEYWICNTTMSCLGRYSTANKAIKVLDMIMEHYDKVMDARCWNNEYQENFFIMPQDSEV